MTNNHMVTTRVFPVALKTLGLLLILATIAVSIPLLLKTWWTDGGTWGFGMVGVPILLPLSLYIFFGAAAFGGERQKQLTMLAHILSISAGLTTMLIFPLYPKGVIILPVVLAVLTMLSTNGVKYYLIAMIILGLAANILLLIWELDYGRAVPVLQLFQGFASA
jgi:hypothetical protein